MTAKNKAKHMNLNELREQAKKNPKKFIGKLVFAKSGVVGVIKDVNENGFVIEPVLNQKQEIDDSVS